MSFQSRPTMYRGIQMRSRLESRVAAFFNRHRIAWEYEPRAYRGTLGEYLPDFQLGPGTFVEVKPPVTAATLTDRADGLRRSVAILRESVPAARLWMVQADGFCVVCPSIVSGYGGCCLSCGRIVLSITMNGCPCGGVVDWIADSLGTTT